MSASSAKVGSGRTLGDYGRSDGRFLTRTEQTQIVSPDYLPMTFICRKRKSRSCTRSSAATTISELPALDLVSRRGFLSRQAAGCENTVPCGCAWPRNLCGQDLPSMLTPGCSPPGSRKRPNKVRAPDHEIEALQVLRELVDLAGFAKPMPGSWRYQFRSSKKDEQSEPRSLGFAL
jgi:hypothetical protein